MSMVETDSRITIGVTAGIVWNTLNEVGPMTMTQLSRKIKGVKNSEIHMAIGWLARENQIHFFRNKNQQLLSVSREFSDV